VIRDIQRTIGEAASSLDEGSNNHHALPVQHLLTVGGGLRWIVGDKKKKPISVSAGSGAVDALADDNPERQASIQSINHKSWPGPFQRRLRISFVRRTVFAISPSGLSLCPLWDHAVKGRWMRTCLTLQPRLKLYWGPSR
jgi:hypothetical protein